MGGGSKAGLFEKAEKSQESIETGWQRVEGTMSVNG